MGKIFFAFITLAATFSFAKAPLKSFQPSDGIKKAYMEGMTHLEFGHFVKPTWDARALGGSLYFYASALDTYKIAFSVDDLREITKSIPADFTGSNSELELELIYSLYNTYYSRLHALRDLLPKLKPETASKRTLPSKIVNTNADLVAQQNDFVFERNYPIRMWLQYRQPCVL
jgi:hypothetical protein